MNKYSIQIYIILIFCIIILSGCRDEPPNNDKLKSDSLTNKPKNEKVEVKTEEDAKKFAEGTWQFTDPGLYWYKFVNRPNGVCEVLTAAPKDGKWTSKVAGTWKVLSDRSESTGKKFYYIKITFYDKTMKRYDDYELPFEDSQTLASAQMQTFGSGIGIKTDKNPWN